ncbi:MAG: hypothetical protein HYW01_04515 [Deltaproteobacteria bacterium]|nr:hypothetical protein [Deltaproteobacteria bacterium]
MGDANVSEEEGVRWSGLDEDISIDNLLDKKPSGESQRSLKRWLEERSIQSKQS